ncbi:MAG: heavy metal translocating P-type ATPase metal-binding domain-containing protein [Acidobacteriota bacterium]
MATAELRSTSTECAHCGLDLPLQPLCDAAGNQFCCAGCEAVFGVIHELGLERYYTLRADQNTQASRGRLNDKSYAELDDAGYQARSVIALAGGLSQVTLYLEGVQCAACIWLLERIDTLTPGLIEVKADLVRSRVTLIWDPSQVSLSQIARRFATLGYQPHPARGLAREGARRREDRAMLMRIGLAGAVAGNVMAIAFALYAGMFDAIEPGLFALFRWASLIVTLPSLLYGGSVFYRGAYNAVRTRSLHMDLPIAIGLTAGFLHGTVNTVRGEGEIYFDSVATLIFLLLVGRFLQRRQQRLAADSTELLAALSPSSARVIVAGRVHEVPLESLLAGMTVELLPGDTVPVDGVVLDGASEIDLSLLTGESAPVSVVSGDPVHAGTLNLSSRLVVEVRSTGEETRIGKLMRLVEEHAARRSNIVQLADRISGVFVAVVLVLAAITVTIWWGRSSEQALDHAIALLIVTCPCALGLATPLAVSAAIGQAARQGILIKGADVLEKLARPAKLLLDKTGTLTEGRLSLTRWDGDTAAQPLLAAIEAHSTHPVARAVQSAFGAAPASGPVDVRETQGGGVAGSVGRSRILAGTESFVRSRGAVVGDAMQMAAAHAVDDGFSPVLIAVDQTVVAVASFGDRLRPDAEQALLRLRRSGHVPSILSGDHPRVVTTVARTLGLSAGDTRGGVSPEGKLSAVIAERERGPVVMIGDGVNDAAALAAAPVGIAVQGGAEAALAAADVFITRRGVMPIAELFDGAARTMRVVRRNLVFSLAYNVLGVALAMTGTLNPLIAAVMMPLSSLTVIISSYRADTFRSIGRSAD